jgi:hypothetical protein
MSSAAQWTQTNVKKHEAEEGDQRTEAKTQACRSAKGCIRKGKELTQP